jgi:hypothetical protein
MLMLPVWVMARALEKPQAHQCKSKLLQHKSQRNKLNLLLQLQLLKQRLVALVAWEVS